MKRQLLFALILVWTTALSGCRELVRTTFPAAPDYAQAETWFEGGCRDGKSYDIFYIVPTCVFDWPNEQGDTCHYMDVSNPSHRASVDGPIHLAKGIFAGEANFFAPYYRQITLESWTESNEVIEARFKVAYADIEASFRYYLKYLNEGRPFILAGHSQGGKAVIELLKRSMTDEVYSRMIAAYPLGYPVREEDLFSPYLVPADDAAGTGVFITFNSVSAPDRISGLLSGSRAAVNPLNWRTDTVPGTKEEHLGSVFTAKDGSIVSEEARIISARLDETTKALVVSGIDPVSYYNPALAELFPPGNYHIVELNLFYRNLQRNVKDRAAAFFACHSEH